MGTFDPNDKLPWARMLSGITRRSAVTLARAMQEKKAFHQTSLIIVRRGVRTPSTKGYPDPRSDDGFPLLKYVNFLDTLWHMWGVAAASVLFGYMYTKHEMDKKHGEGKLGLIYFALCLVVVNQLAK